MPPRRKKHRSVKLSGQDMALVAAYSGALGATVQKVAAVTAAVQKAVTADHDLMRLEGKWSWCRRCGRLREEWWEGQYIGDEGPKTNKITRWRAIGQLITEGEPPCIL